MIYKSDVCENNAVINAAHMMAAASRTAPKACGIDATDTLILDGSDKDALADKMRELAKTPGMEFFARDAGNIDKSHAIILIGSSVSPRGLDCRLCGVSTCAEAKKGGVSCAMSVSDLGISVGSAASIAADCRIDNRVLFSAGVAAIQMELFPKKIAICFGIGLSVSGKNVYFDRKPI